MIGEHRILLTHRVGQTVGGRRVSGWPLTPAPSATFCRGIVLGWIKWSSGFTNLKQLAERLLAFVAAWGSLMRILSIGPPGLEPWS